MSQFGLVGAAAPDSPLDLDFTLEDHKDDESKGDGADARADEEVAGLIGESPDDDAAALVAAAEADKAMGDRLDRLVNGAAVVCVCVYVGFVSWLK